jgi:hypothetical protein
VFSLQKRKRRIRLCLEKALTAQFGLRSMDSNQTHTEGMAQRRRWRERQHLARLCDLVADSLLPYLVGNSGRRYLVTPAFPRILSRHAVFPCAGTRTAGDSAARALERGRAVRTPDARPGNPLASI